MTEAQQPRPEDQATFPAFALSPDWSAGYSVPVKPANVFLAQLGAATDAGRPEGAYLIAGQVSPPIVLGTPEEVVRHANEDLAGKLAVDVHCRLFLTRDRVVELMNLLADTVSKLDAASGDVQ